MLAAALDSGWLRHLAKPINKNDKAAAPRQNSGRRKSVSLITRHFPFNKQ